MSTNCEGCAERRAMLLALGKKMAAWVKHPIGPPPLDLSGKPKLPESNVKDESENP